MNIHIAEQKTVLPLTARAVPCPRTLATRHHDLVESCMLALILLLAVSQCLILYGAHEILDSPASEEICTYLTDLAVGLRLSIPCSLPTAALVFVASPYFARPERLLDTWYLIMLCYFVGTTLGALLLLRV